MKKFLLAVLFFVGISAPAHAEFTGDVKLACEAVLCLSTGQRPSACAPSIARYFSIKLKKWNDTVNARRNFLNLCPTASQDGNMQALVNAIANGAGMCDAATLNATLNQNPLSMMGDGLPVISNVMPSICLTYFSNAYVDAGLAPRYVGTPETGGMWVEAKDYERALAEYNFRMANTPKLPTGFQ